MLSSIRRLALLALAAAAAGGPPSPRPAPTALAGSARPAAAAQATESRLHLPMLVHAALRDVPTPAALPTDAPATAPTAAPTVAPTASQTPDPTPTSTPPLPDFEPFGLVRLAPDLLLEGSGSTIDSLAFWEAPDPADSLLLVTAKGNQRVEVWRQPFLGRELPALQHPSFGTGTQVNGIVIDQELDRVYIAVSRPASTVAVFALPGLAFLGELVQGAVDLRSEPNLALLTLPDGVKRLFVSADDRVYAYDPESGAALGGFAPGHSFETLLADDVDQVLYIPDEVGRSGVYAFNPVGSPYYRAGEARFGGQGVFEADAEGIALYACLTPDGTDDGRGLLIVSDQKADASDFEFFDRRSWAHLGRLQLDGVRFTDGIASTQQALPGHPAGLFAAVDDDTNVALIGWERIVAATGLGCGNVP